MWLAIILLLIIGILLIVVELIFIPGTTIFGIAGLILAAAGVVLTFFNFGTGSGLLTLGITFAGLVVLVVISIRSGTWDKVSLKSASTSRVNDEVKNNLWKGDRGITLSALRPSGKAEFKDAIVEVSTMGQYLKEGVEIRIIAIQDNRILVEAAVNQQNQAT